MALWSATLIEEEIKNISVIGKNKDNDSNNKKRKAQVEEDTENKDNDNVAIFDYALLQQLSSFDISTKKITFSNGNMRVPTSKFEVKCHPQNNFFLNRIRCWFWASDEIIQTTTISTSKII